MPKVSEMIPSKFLKESDVGDGRLFTIKDVKEVNIARNADEPIMKWVMYFQETPKGLVLNNTNIKRLEKICGSDNTDDWAGQQVVVYWDDSVEFMGEIVGGMRVRAPKRKEEAPLPF